MNWPRRFQFGQRLLLLLGAFSLGFLAYGAWTYRTLQTVQVGGPLYERIEASQNLLSDVLPPPSYIVESYLTCLQIATATAPEQQGQLIERLRKLEADYLQRHQYWIDAHLDTTLADTLLHSAHVPAMAFYAQMNQEFLPAVYRNDTVLAKRALGNMARLYEEHRHAIDQVVVLARQSARQRETSALAQIEATGIQQVVILVISLIVAIGLVLLIRIERAASAGPGQCGSPRT
ncbi:MAG: hypothetical protein U5M53_10585 [Rhodoferax sp.]|nr:hypothetical protein [Rhodoferax sp.]